MEYGTDSFLLLSMSGIGNIIIFICFVPMYRNILNKLYHGTFQEASQAIFDCYQRQGYAIVDYVYFANIVAHRVFDVHTVPVFQDMFRDALLADYRVFSREHICSAYQTALLDADVLLPDGIALQIFTFLATKKWLYNLNGTDFCLRFLEYVRRQVGNDRIHILLYGTYPHILEKTKQFLLQQWFDVIYAQDGYTSLRWHHVELALKGKQQDVNILLVARSTPLYPIQELWSFANKDRIAQYGLLVMNQWGTFDFWVGEQKRAPLLVRKLKWEWLWRLFSDPKRNIKKVWYSFSLFSYIFRYLIWKKCMK